MGSDNRNGDLELSSPEVYEVPGEPAVIINGVPTLSPSDAVLVNCNIQVESETQSISGFGEWLEGREVRKLFEEQYYSGIVTKHNEESGWYRVVYEDGDSEDLEWNELRDVLVPLSLNVPLKSLASKVFKGAPEHSNGGGKRGRGRPRKDRSNPSSLIKP